MSEVTIITFANQKGGVGKTTLCTLFANYLVNRGKRTIVIDCDGQQTIFEKRKADYKKYPDQKEVQGTGFQHRRPRECQEPDEESAPA